MIGWYYLHTNGDLIYKRELGDTHADLRESTFVRAMWPVDPGDRAGAWKILVEALAAGANKNRVMKLAEKWNCNNEDALIYADHIGVKLSQNDDKWHAQCGQNKTIVGSEDTALKALATLCIKLGYKPSKMWGSDFHSLVKTSCG